MNLNNYKVKNLKEESNDNLEFLIQEIEKLTKEIEEKSNKGGGWYILTDNFNQYMKTFKS